MSIVLVGINHKTAPVEVRELLAFSEEACTAGVRTLVDGDIVREGLIVSTCNRVEVLAATTTEHIIESSKRIGEFLAQARNLPEHFFRDHLYNHTDEQAVRHVFRVASSLDSMVVGEPQVLGQVRRAYSIALDAGTAGRILNRLIHHTLRVAKRVRSETGIAANAVSISYMAVELGKKIFGSLKGQSVLLIGAGEMAELCARHLISAGVSRVLVTNRTEEAAARLARDFGGQAVAFERIPDSLPEADIVVCSTGAGEYVVTGEMAREALTRRRNRPAFFIDISVPRNLDPAIGALPNAFVFDIDDLESVVSSNIREREREAERAELIIDSEVMQFQQSLRVLDVGPSIGALRERLQDIAKSELARQRNRLGALTPEQERAIEAMMMSTVNKISHPLIRRIRQSYDPDDLEKWGDTFDVDDLCPDPEEPSEPNSGY